jgi:hypothetical protein
VTTVPTGKESEQVPDCLASPYPLSLSLGFTLSAMQLMPAGLLATDPLPHPSCQRTRVPVDVVVGVAVVVDVVVVGVAVVVDVVVGVVVVDVAVALDALVVVGLVVPPGFFTMGMAGCAEAAVGTASGARAIPTPSRRVASRYRSCGMIFGRADAPFGE